MKNLAFLFSLLLSASLSLEAQEYYTVIAPSGLNLRASPGPQGKKIVTLPHGTAVAALYDDEPTVEATIEDKLGYWLKVQYRTDTGYVFSGFLEQGAMTVPPTNINFDYRLLEPGVHCSPANYDPALYWYAMVKDNNQLILRKVKIAIVPIDKLPEEEKAEMDCPECFLLKVQADVEDSVFFYLGTRQPLEEGKVVSQFQGDHWNYSGGARFLYPEQDAQTYLAPFSYRFWASERITIRPDLPSGYEESYQLSFSMTKDFKNWSVFDISQELSLAGESSRHATYKTPQLIWWGDLNSDGLLDFIWYSHTMTDSCGVCWEYHLFMSDKNNPDRPIRKVADHVECNCLT